MPRVIYRRTTTYVADIGNKTDCSRGETVRHAAGGKVDRKEQIICSSVLRRPPLFVRRGQFRARKFFLSRAFSQRIESENQAIFSSVLTQYMPCSSLARSR